jgi:hypothetical protein
MECAAITRLRPRLDEFGGDDLSGMVVAGWRPLCPARIDGTLKYSSLLGRAFVLHVCSQSHFNPRRPQWLSIKRRRRAGKPLKSRGSRLNSRVTGDHSARKTAIGRMRDSRGMKGRVRRNEMSGNRNSGIALERMN